MRPIPIICVLLVLSGLVPVVLAGEAYVFVTAWGSFGTGDGQFGHITGVSVHDPLFVYVSEYYWLPNETHPNHRIQKFGQSGTFIQSFGGSGSGEGRLLYPMDVATDSAGNVYVADAENHRIQKFTSTGTYLASWGSMGSGDGEFYIPVGIAVDGAGTIYVADRNHRIQKFTSTGTFLMKWGEKGDAAGQFNWLQGIATDSAGNVYVADSGNDRVQKFTSTGTYLASWGSTGEGDGQLDFPTGIAVDADGNVYVGDGDNRRIQKFRRTSLSVTSPDGESWVPTRTYPITWTQEGLSGTNVKIELYTGGMGLAKVGTIASVWPAGAGTYSWTIPADQEPGTRYLVKVTSLLSGGPEDYAGFVTLVSSPALTVTSPESGDSWIAGTVHPVTWTQEGLSGTNVRIELYTGGMDLARVGTIAAVWPAGAGTYSWKIPADQEPGTRYLVKVTSLLSGGPEDYSGSLTITHLTPTPTPRPFPNSGLPQDLDRDGRYEDVNGNGRADFADVVLYFNQMTWIAANEPIALFDYNVNGRIDFADVVWLFNTL